MNVDRREFVPEGESPESDSKFSVTDDGKLEQDDDHSADFEEDLTFD
jgi:hypothetical protein